jgi:hypothetical protein
VHGHDLAVGGVFCRHLPGMDDAHETAGIALMENLFALAMVLMLK